MKFKVLKASMAVIKIFNSLSGEKEPLPQTKRHPLRLFVCGPTVYDYPHIGNARTFIVFDIIVRYLRSRGFKVFYLQNITDIDDKIIDRAKQEKTAWKEVSNRYEKIFRNNIERLGIDSVSRYAKATDYIPEIISQVKRLIKNANAYLIPGDGYYFDLKTFPDYGKLSKRTVEQAEDATSRIDVSDKKRNKGDFALWKLSERAEPGWQTELGFGRPGWHIEDTAIAEHFFGLQYELHGGGVDLKFPHHEAEIAQAESISGKKPFVKIWMHAGPLYVRGKKMSKSLGNFITVDDFLRNNSSDVFRWLVLTHNYRSPLDYTPKSLEQTKSSFGKVLEFLAKLDFAAKSGGLKRTKVSAEKAIKKAENGFWRSMDDDFNSPAALANIFSLISDYQEKIWKIGKNEAKKLSRSVKLTLKTVGFAIKLPPLPVKIKKIVKTRELLRKNKQFIQSDALRKEVNGLGYIVEDTPFGPFIWPKNPL